MGRAIASGLEGQHAKWVRTYATRPDFLGASASEPAKRAVRWFRAGGVRELLELGPGQGRDSLLFAAAGMSVTALDFAEDGLTQISRKAEAAGLSQAITPIEHDVRRPLPLPDASFDACFSHMLFSMALRTGELERLTAEVHRVLRARGLLVYTVRNTTDPHFGSGDAHGDGMFEMGGFIVHFFDRALIDRLAAGFELLEVSEYREGKLPRRLFGVTMRKR
jgi:SAM-dependent methyltransferase